MVPMRPWREALPVRPWRTSPEACPNFMTSPRRPPTSSISCWRPMKGGRSWDVPWRWVLELFDFFEVPSSRKKRTDTSKLWFFINVWSKSWSLINNFNKLFIFSLILTKWRPVARMVWCVVMRTPSPASSTAKLKPPGEKLEHLLKTTSANYLQQILCIRCL